LIAQSWFANGKLLITGEYLVMDGAKALALPVKVGQYLSCKKSKDNRLIWNAFKPDGIWFQTILTLPDLKITNTTNPQLSQRLAEILQKTRSLNKDFLQLENGFNVETILEFDPEYGFGSSSTLIANLAGWAGVDPFELQKITFGGSGYDIACARVKQPVLYQIVDELPVVSPINYNPPFKDQIYFVYLGNKKRSDESIKNFRKNASYSPSSIDEFTKLTDYILEATDIQTFERLLREHEQKMATILKTPTVQSLFFPDHIDVVKSLGAWGGDFVLMTTRMDEKDFHAYLQKKGYSIVYKYSELILS